MLQTFDVSRRSVNINDEHKTDKTLATETGYTTKTQYLLKMKQLISVWVSKFC